MLRGSNGRGRGVRDQGRHLPERATIHGSHLSILNGAPPVSPSGGVTIDDDDSDDDDNNNKAASVHVPSMSFSPQCEHGITMSNSPGSSSDRSRASAPERGG